MDLSKLSDADLESLAKGDMAKVSDEALAHLSRPQSSYDGVPDKDLAWYQKAERAVGKAGFIKPGQELFSPAAMENKKAAAPYIAGAVALPAAAIAAGPSALATIAGLHPVTKGAMGAAIGTKALETVAGPIKRRLEALFGGGH